MAHESSEAGGMGNPRDEWSMIHGWGSLYWGVGGSKEESPRFLWFSMLIVLLWITVKPECIHGRFHNSRLKPYTVLSIRMGTTAPVPQNKNQNFRGSFMSAQLQFGGSPHEIKEWKILMTEYGSNYSKIFQWYPKPGGRQNEVIWWRNSSRTQKCNWSLWHTYGPLLCHSRLSVCLKACPQNLFYWQFK